MRQDLASNEICGNSYSERWRKCPNQRPSVLTLLMHLVFEWRWIKSYAILSVDGSVKCITSVIKDSYLLNIFHSHVSQSYSKIYRIAAICMQIFIFMIISRRPIKISGRFWKNISSSHYQFHYYRLQFHPLLAILN